MVVDHGRAGSTTRQAIYDALVEAGITFQKWGTAGGEVGEVIR